jgi:hypothetical protein
MRRPSLALFISIASLAVTACSSGLHDGDLDMRDGPGVPKRNPNDPVEPRPSDGVAPTGQPAPEAPRDQSNDAGGGASDAGSSVDATPPPAPIPFLKIDLRYPAATDLFITQCSPDEKTQWVWKTTASGTDAYSRFANPAYTQLPNVLMACGTKSADEFPIVLTWTNAGAIPNGTFVVKCMGPNLGHVYKVTTAVDGRPAATWQYAEVHPACN